MEGHVLFLPGVLRGCVGRKKAPGGVRVVFRGARPGPHALTVLRRLASEINYGLLVLEVAF